MARDRRAELQKPGATLNGIDFVEVAAPDQQRFLTVHFLNRVALVGQVSAITITGGESIPTVLIQPVTAADWTVDSAGRPLLRLTCVAPGDFSTYTLTLTSTLLDTPYLNQAQFSFKALCPSSLDCRTPDPVCDGSAADLPAIDYLAKDFSGFRKALSDFAAQRYPGWQERAEADLGVVMMELLSAVADDLSYYQDRASTEAYLETATERVSLVRHARLVDYEPSPAVSASVWLQCRMSGPGGIPAGLLVSTASPDGSGLFFETGTGLADTSTYAARVAWNELTPYWLDDSEMCLAAGSTSMYLQGQGLGFQPGQRLLIETTGAAPGDQPKRQIVRLAATPAQAITDAVFGTAITRIDWIADDALLSARDLQHTTVKGNIVPATQGRRYVETFAIGSAPASSPQIPPALCRSGPRQSPVYHYTLSQSPLSWQGTAAQRRPEIRLTSPGLTWDWRRWLLDAQAQDFAFTVDPALYTRIAINPDQSIQHDYDGEGGDTVRFGDGQFGNVPETGSVFEVTYRAGGGQAGNVAPDSIWRVEQASAVSAVTNPFAGEGGADAETALSLVRRAPQAFRAILYRAVLEQDYETAARTLPWVQQGGTAFRWTGSWVTVFTTPDPRDSTTLTRARRIQLLDLLNRYRMAGYESYVPNPRYAALDLKIKVCARADAFRGDVQAAVIAALTQFFDPDNFTFGQPLERSRLESAVQDSLGVGGVLEVLYRRRGVTSGFVNLPGTLAVGFDEIVLVENNPSRPERGSFHVDVKGGK